VDMRTLFLPLVDRLSFRAQGSSRASIWQQQRRT
jgi:hypothetical protein